MVATVTSQIKIDNSGLKEVKKAILELKKKVKVGYLTDPELANKAYINTVGGEGHFLEGDKIDIPPRPFIEHAIREFGKEIIENAALDFDEGFNLKNTKYFIEDSAKNARDAIQISIDTASQWSKYPHNSPRTIEEKGFDKPLVETGAMRDNVEYKILGG